MRVSRRNPPVRHKRPLLLDQAYLSKRARPALRRAISLTTMLVVVGGAVASFRYLSPKPLTSPTNASVVPGLPTPQAGSSTPLNSPTLATILSTPSTRPIAQAPLAVPTFNTSISAYQPTLNTSLARPIPASAPVFGTAPQPNSVPSATAPGSDPWSVLTTPTAPPAPQR